MEISWATEVYGKANPNNSSVETIAITFQMPHVDSLWSIDDFTDM